MPVKNAAEFLDDTLESIIEQKHEHWELIAVNDHSADESKDVLLSNASLDPRIQVLDNEGQGIIDALSQGYERSSGAYITRMDADDLMHPLKLDKLLNACAPKSVSTCKVYYFRDDRPLGEGYERYAQWLNRLIDQSMHWDEIYKECVIPSPAWMMERETFDSIGGFSASRYPEDYDLVFRMYAAGLKVNGVDDILHAWRDHGSRASRNDEHYADNRFLDLKLHYFLNLDLDHTRPLALWGAGTKGKYLAQALNAINIPFSWHTDNEKKWQAPIYGQVLRPSQEIAMDAQVIYAIAEQDALADTSSFEGLMRWC